MEAVQYIVVRKDLVEKMGVGKTAAQVAHASIATIFGREQYYALLRNDIDAIIGQPALRSWIEGRFTKLVVCVKSKQQMLNLKEKLDSEGIVVRMIYDCCLTMLEPEEDNGTTLTCMGVVPLFRDSVPKCLQKLQLL
jgi:peptidyl-tRNA hydrolase